MVCDGTDKSVCATTAAAMIILMASLRDSEPFHFARKRLSFDSQNQSGLRLIPCRRAEHRFDVPPFGFLEWHEVVFFFNRRRGRRRPTSTHTDRAQRARRGFRIRQAL